MFKIAIWNIVKWAFAHLPIEQILAKAFTYALSKVKDTEDFAKVVKTIEHCAESVNFMSEIIEDAVVTDNEANLIVTKISQLKADIIATWARGASAKDLQAKLTKTKDENPA